MRLFYSSPRMVIKTMANSQKDLETRKIIENESERSNDISQGEKETPSQSSAVDESSNG
jgi:hypothetical protein